MEIFLIIIVILIISLVPLVRTLILNKRNTNKKAEDSIKKTEIKIEDNNLQDREISNNNSEEILNATHTTEEVNNTVACIYCGTENEINKRKCSSCGASLKTKK